MSYILRDGLWLNFLEWIEEIDAVIINFMVQFFSRSNFIHNASRSMEIKKYEEHYRWFIA